MFALDGDQLGHKPVLTLFDEGKEGLEGNATCDFYFFPQGKHVQCGT